MDSRLGEGTSRCQTVCPWAVRWADALGAVPGRPWDGIWHTGDVIGHTRDVLGRPVDGRIVPRTSTGQWTHYGRSSSGPTAFQQGCCYFIWLVNWVTNAPSHWPVHSWFMVMGCVCTWPTKTPQSPSHRAVLSTSGITRSGRSAKSGRPSTFGVELRPGERDCDYPISKEMTVNTQAGSIKTFSCP